MNQFLQQHQQKLIQFAKDNHLTYLALFGSHARAEETKDSDIDLLYDYEQPMGLIKAAGIQLKLESLLNTKVDFISRKFLKPRFKKEIESSLVQIYAKS